MFTRKAFLVAAVAAGALAATAAPAGAYSIAYTYGYPGYVQTPWILGHASTATGAAAVYFPSQTIGKSTAYSGYNQYVCVVRHLEYAFATSLDNTAPTWADLDSARSCTWISGSATYANFADWARQVPLDSVILGTGAYWVHTVYSGWIDVTWQLGNGSYIARKQFNYNAVGDYRCTSSSDWCSIRTLGGEAFLVL